jgi:MFS transporter, AAHS family, benzoate transport protein
MPTHTSDAAPPAVGESLTPRSPRWGIILICLAVTIMEGYNLIVYGAVVPLIIADETMGITNESAGLAGSAVYVGMLLGATIAGVIGDRYGRQRTLIVVMIMFIIGAVFAGLSVSAPTLGGARFFSGLGVGGAVTTALAISRSSASPSQAGVVVTVTMAGIPIGGTIASLIAMPVMPAFGWRPMFFIGAALTSLILLIVVAVRLEAPSSPKTDQPATAPRGGFSALFQDRRAIVALIIAAAAIPNMFTWYGLNTWLTAIMGELDYELTDALLFAFTLTGGAILGSFLTMNWADRWGIAKVGSVMAALTLIGLVGISMGPDTIGFSLGCVALMGAGGHSTMNLINAATTNLFPEEIRATALGWSNGTSYVGAIVGPTAGGFVLGSAMGAVGVFVLYGISAAFAAIAMLALAAAEIRRVRTKPLQEVR